MADEYNDDESQSNTSTCRVYDTEDIFTFLVQLILGGIAIAFLYWKRYFEHPRRKFSIWFLDISKQGIGCVYAHILNMVIAAVLSRQVYENESASDECAWYGISFVIDTTIGLALSIVLLHLLDTFAKKHEIVPLMHLGVYTGDSALYHWTAQLISWMLILTTVKFTIYIFMYLFMGALSILSTILFTLPFSGHRRFELVFVMILMPGVLNVMYFWIADNNLKAGDDETAAHEPDEGKTEQLLQLPETKSNDETKRNTNNNQWTVFNAASVPPSASV